MSHASARRTTPQQFQRETNTTLVLRSLREQGPASRSELAEIIGIDRSTMTSIASELLSVSLVTETEGDSPGSRGGRRKQILSLASRRVVTAGVDIDEERAIWTLCALSGEVVATGVLRRAVVDVERWIAAVMGQLEQEIDSWASSGHEPRPLVAGAGIGIPGLYDPATRVLRESVVLGCRDLDLSKIRVSADVPLEPLVDNDANCCAWTIADTQHSSGTTIFVQLKLHRHEGGGFRDSIAGVGLSFVMDGRVYYGSSHAAGELKGYRWSTGERDQLGMGSAEAVSEEQVICELLRNLGVIATAFDPSRIVLGGDLSDQTSRVSRILQRQLADTAIAPLYGSGVLQVARPGEYTVSEGAARMVLHTLFSMPVVHEFVPVQGSWRSIMNRLQSTANGFVSS